LTEEGMERIDSMASQTRLSMAWSVGVQPTPHLEYSSAAANVVSLGNNEDVLNFFDLKFRRLEISESYD